MPQNGTTPPGQAERHRLNLALAGPRRWGREQATGVLAGLDREVLWITDTPPPGAEHLPAARARSLLGRDLQAAVFDAWAGLDLEALGAVTGAVVGGGVFLLLCPPLEDWPDYPDPDHARIAVHPYTGRDVSGRFLRRFARIVAEHPGVRIATPAAPPQALPTTANGTRRPAPRIAGAASFPCRTADQARAVEAVLRVALGHRRRPAVLTAHRGRGKSTALGIAAARLLGQGYGDIVVTAPAPQAAEACFQMAARLLGQDARHRFAIHRGEAAMRFVPPDALIHETRRPRLVLVDEAAAIPTPLLARLLARHPRMVFATTEHGYEGSGRGFTLRFRHILDERTRGWREIRLTHPIRWAPGDPLESFVFEALLLEAAPAPDEMVQEAEPGSLVFERLDRDRLAEDERLLRELFGLLVTAHYRTRPTDLRHLLDGINIRIWAAFHQGHVVACALSAREGGFDVHTARETYERRRRPHGHLLPETLAAHAGIDWAPTLACERILRIAVHPRLQGRGIGSALVRHLERRLRKEDCDYLGTAFGATPALLRFWWRLGLQPVRLGVRRDAASGEHSAVLLRPYTAAGRRLTREARARFLDGFPHLLTDPLRDLEPELVRLLLRRTAEDAPMPGLSPTDRADAASFAFGRRGYEVNLPALWRLGLTAFAAGASLDETLLQAWTAKVLQRLDWEAVARRTGLSGRAAVEQALRRAAARLLEVAAPGLSATGGQR